MTQVNFKNQSSNLNHLRFDNCDLFEVCTLEFELFKTGFFA